MGDAETMAQPKLARKEQGEPWTQSALRVLEKRYLSRGEGGQVVESPEQMLERVAEAVASVERTAWERARWRKRFYDVMVARRFLPNSPTLMNAGKPNGQLSACFVLPIEDSLESIFSTLKAAALIHKSGGGTGFSFSRLRARGSEVRSTKGVASGPVSFLRVYDSATEAIKQGGARRGANMAVLRADHPDIEEFILSKRDGKGLSNFNISVGVTSRWMDSQLQRPDILKKIVECAWACGDPGLVFLDRINLFNPTPLAGRLESTNPCGEQPLLDYESCNLGSLNLGKYWLGGGQFNWDVLRSDIRVAVRFLDNVIDANVFPLSETRRLTKRNRKIGLGVMGFADLLLFLGVPYDSDGAVNWAERLMGFIDREAKTYSAQLAKERGRFPAWRGSLWEQLGYPEMRNATLTTVAPTGTLSLLAGCSSGIEPIFAASLARNVLDGERLEEIHPAIRVKLSSQAQHANINDFSENVLERVLGEAWSPAHRVSVGGHLRIQAAFQRFSDSAVSKTVNLPPDATKEDVGQAFELAYRLGCKGITVFRDGCREHQVLEKVESCETC